MQTTVVVLACGNLLTREGIKAVLLKEFNFAKIVEVANLLELKNRLLTHKMDLLVIDYSFKLIDYSILTQYNSQIKIVALLDTAQQNVVQNFIQSGVHSCLSITCDQTEIKEAVTCCLNNQKFFCTKIINALEQSTNQIENDFISCDGFSISDRELAIIKLICQGNTTNHIAGKLFISVHTVSTHRKNILKKLHLKSTPELILFALKNNWISK